MIWVVDASVALRWFLLEEAHPNADLALRKMVEQPGRFAVPEVFAFEVYSVLQRLHPEPLRAYLEGVEPLLRSGILRVPLTAALAQAADRFVKMGLVGYDACYLALAEDLGGVWLTFDRKAHRKVSSTGLSSLLEKAVPEEWRAQE